MSEEKKFEVKVHLISGITLTAVMPATLEQLNDMYDALGAKAGVLKIPTDWDTQQFIPVRSVLRLEAKGPWDKPE